jgi:hypothetical protein
MRNLNNQEAFMAETVAVYDLEENHLGDAQIEHDERGMWIDGHPVRKTSPRGAKWIVLDVNWFNRETGTHHQPVLIER